MRDTLVSWQKILADGFANTQQLLQYLELPVSLGSLAAEKQFKTRVPRSFAERMQRGNPDDPLLMQVLASTNELIEVDGYVADPLRETTTNPLQGMIHKYHGRVLLTVAGACAVNCRYCFRRHFPYENNNPGSKGWGKVIDYINNNVDIHEVIFSGGDPLLAADSVLHDLIVQLTAIPHVKTLRIHTRIPIVLPERITGSLLAILAESSLRKVIVLHCNHAQEIDNKVKQACSDLQGIGCHLLNQSVLLKGINDCPVILAELSESLFDCGILPYYLHLLDKVAGAAHFDIPVDMALSIHQQLKLLLPGYLVPRLAREEPGKGSKTIL